jgi:hypothetical protein
MIPSLLAQGGWGINLRLQAKVEHSHPVPPETGRGRGRSTGTPTVALVDMWSLCMRQLGGGLGNQVVAVLLR